MIHDPIELSRLQLVCPLWCDIIEEILQQHSGWKELCEKVIPDFWLLASLKEKCPDYYEQQCVLDDKKVILDGLKPEPEDWRSIYVSWKNFQMNVMKLPKSLDTSKTNPFSLLTFSEPEQITCMESIAGVLALATNQGIIYFYNVKDLRIPFFVGDHGQPVTEIGFLIAKDYCHHFYSVSMSADGHFKYWNLLERKEAHNQSNGHLSRLLVAARSGCFSIWDRVASYYHINSNSINRLWESKLLPDTDQIEIVALQPELLLHSRINQNDIRFLIKINMITFDNKRNRATWYCLCCPPLDVNFLSNARSRRLPANVVSARVKKFSLLSRSMATCVADHLLALSIKNSAWTAYNILERLGGNVTSICLGGTLRRMLIGLDTGDVYMFTVKDFDDWRNFSFSVANGVKWTLNSEPIMLLCTSDCNYRDEYIIVGTARKIHVHHRDTDSYDNVARDISQDCDDVDE